MLIIADELHHPAESEFRRCLHSASSHKLCVPHTRLSTYGDRAFPVAAVRISISHLLRHFPSSALALRHTSSNSVTRNHCCRLREVTLSFMDTLIALTYLLPYLLHGISCALLTLVSLVTITRWHYSTVICPIYWSYNNNNNNNQYIYKQRQSHAMSQRRWLATAVIFRPSDMSLGFAET